jgi:arabinofuranan 3-O-arabinosyltransferase
VFELGAGEHTVVATTMTAPLTLDRVVLSTPGERADPPLNAAVRVIEESARSHALEVDCPAGCWLVLGMGHNDAWKATAAGNDLGDPDVVDGGFNGWWMEPMDGPERITLIWTAQRAVTVGLVVSLLCVLGLIVIVLASALRRRGHRSVNDASIDDIGRSARGSWVFAASVAAAVAVLIAPLWGAVALIVASGDVALRATGRRRHVLAVSGTLLAAFVAASVVVIERRDAPFPNAGWTTAFDHLHAMMLTAVVLVAASTFINPRAQ